MGLSTSKFQFEGHKSIYWVLNFLSEGTFMYKRYCCLHLFIKESNPDFFSLSENGVNGTVTSNGADSPRNRKEKSS